MQPQQPQYLDPNAQSVKQRKLIMIAIILAVLGLVFLGLTAIFGGESSTEKLGLVLARQQALLTALEENQGGPVSGQYANQISQTKLLLVSANQELAAAGITVNETQAAQAFLPDAAADLQQAIAEDRYGEEASALIVQVVDLNQADLNSTLPEIKKAELKALIEQLIANNQSILESGS